MKLIYERWCKYLKEGDSVANDVIVIDNKNPPSSGDPEIDKIISSILDNLDPSDLHKNYKSLHKKGNCDPLTGFCRITTEVFWELVNRLEGYNKNYKPCRVVHQGGPHYFIKDIKTGQIIDLTAGQFRNEKGEHVPVPYEDGLCDTEESRLASKNWSNRRGQSRAMPGYNLGRGALSTIDRIAKTIGESKQDMPFSQEQIDESTFIREFSQNINSEELIWHMDRKDRTVTILESNGWEFQKDNELPKILKEGDVLFIPKYTYHRVIKGSGKLIVEIKEEIRKTGSKWCLYSKKKTKKGKKKKLGCYKTKGGAKKREKQVQYFKHKG
jgi:hypothetical protein